MKVVIIASDFPKYEEWCPNFTGMKAGLANLKIPFLFLTCRPTFTDFEQVRTFAPDVIVYVMRDIIYQPSWRRRLREENPKAKIVMWYGDMRREQNQADCSEMDAMFVSNDAQENFYKKTWGMKAVHYLPLGCRPLAEPMYKSKFDLSFVFIGSQVTDGDYQARATEIENFKIKADLTVINSFENPMRLKIYQEMPAIYSSAKISLDISHYIHIKGYTSNRFFVIPAFFGFALTRRFPGCEDLYPENTRVYFDTFEEALEKKKYYLSHETERLAMVNKGHAWSKNHTYEKRFKKMFEVLKLA